MDSAAQDASATSEARASAQMLIRAAEQQRKLATLLPDEGMKAEMLAEAQALADADEAVRRRPEWNKGHFRRAECLKQAGLHAEAHAAYATAARLDPADAHVQKACVEAQARHASQQRTERLYAVVGALAGVVLFALLVLAPPTPVEGKRAPPPLELRLALELYGVPQREVDIGYVATRERLAATRAAAQSVMACRIG